MPKHQINNSVGGFSYDTRQYVNYSFEPHFHRNYEILYVMTGNVQVTAGGHTEQLCQGDFAMILSNEVHEILSQDHSVFVICVFSGEFVPEFHKAALNKTGNTCRFRCDKTTLDFLTSHVLYSENLAKRKQNPYQLTAALYLMCDQYLRSVQLTARDAAQHTMMNEIVEYIENNYRRDIKLKEIAQLLGYDYYYCSRQFGSVFGMRFTDYVNKLRCSAAAELMRSTDKHISAIALDSGFQSIRNFNDAFLKHMGITPQEYRERQTKQLNIHPGVL